MTDTRSDARKQVLTYVDKKPFVELTGEEWVFPITTPDEQYKLYFHMTSYESYEVKKFYDYFLPRRHRRTGVEHSIELPDTPLLKEFIKKHFIGLSGVALEDDSTPTMQQQLDWLNNNPSFWTRVFRYGYDAVGVPVEKKEKSRKVVLVFDRQEFIVTSQFILYSNEREMEETIKLTHTLGKLTEAERHQYNKALQTIENSRYGELYTEGNWDVIEGLYDKKISRVEGVLFDGKSCTETNKADWISSIPYCVKAYVMGQCMMDVELKNAS